MGVYFKMYRKQYLGPKIYLGMTLIRNHLETTLRNPFTPESYLCFLFPVTDFDKPDFKRSIVCFEDLSVGAVLTGKVENATPFGVFVDIGVGKAGLIPVRNITEAKLSKVKKRRSLGLGPGERVEVKVLNVDIPRLRITLDLIRVL